MATPIQPSEIAWIYATAPYGFDWISNTTANTGKWYCIIAIADGTTLSALSANTKVPASVTNMPLPVGLPITGDFTSITLSAGQVLAYRLE